MSVRGRAVLSGLAVAVLFALPLVPEIVGARRLVFRDAQITHWPWRRVAMASLSAGQVPFVNASASGGEPFLANPNAVLLYPTMLLEKVLPPAAAFNLHYLLHVLWAFFGARLLARRMGIAPGASFFAGVTFAFSGMMMSYASAFANSGAAASWLPWCAAAVLGVVRARAKRDLLRASAAAAIALGLQLLAGEPALSVLTVAFCAFLAGMEVFSAGSPRRAVFNLLPGGVMTGVGAAALAAPLLLPLWQVLPLTYRGQHVYSQRAFGASPFLAWRALEWLFPRFNGDPGALFADAHWQYALHKGDLIYIWCVTLGVLPLAVVAVACLKREFWERRTIWLAAAAATTFVFALGASFPLFRLLGSSSALRRLRYPIKFYLLTTLCVALLAGFAAERLRPSPARAGRKALAVVLLLAVVFVKAFLSAGAGGFVEKEVAPYLAVLAAPAADLLPAIRRSLAGDALFGLLATGVLALVLFSRRPIRGQNHLLAVTALLLAFPWALPLFVSADERDLARAPAVAAELKGEGGVYVSPRLPEFNVLASGTRHPDLPPRVVKLARVQIEELVPATGAPFGVRYVFDADPDGSYGWYNRLAEEALGASTPEQQSRLLRLYGARWLVDDQGESHPGFEPVTGFAVAGRRLVLSQVRAPLPEIRWAGRAWRRASLSGALELVRSDRFDPESDVVLPGPSDSAPANQAGRSRVSIEHDGPAEAAATVEAEQPGHVIFSRTYFKSWKAKLDGRDAPLLVANGRDLAVAVPAGSHRVEFFYDRSPLERGVLFQSLAFLAIAGIAIVRAART